jgi:hypothetical protein
MPDDIDESRWPLVVVRWRGAISDAELDFMLSRMDAWLERAERFGLLLDSRGAAGLSPEQRNHLIAHMKSRAALTARYLLQAMVIDSLVQRTLFFAINLAFPNPFPSKTFGEPEGARLWLEGQLARPRVAA